MPQITVLIVNYLSGDRLAACLAKLQRQTFTDFDVVIVDNGSEDGSLQFLDDSPFKNVRVLSKNKNLGFAAGMNLGAQAATAPWIALLNPDAYPAPDWLENLAAALQRYPGVRSFGSVQIDYNDPEKLDGVGDVFHATGIAYRGDFGAKEIVRPLQDGLIFAPCGAASLLHRETFLQSGGFEERFFCYFEDVEYGFRQQLKGAPCVLVAKAIVYHEGSAISGRRSDFTVYHGTRNRVWAFIKNMPMPLLIFLLPIHLIFNLLFLVRAIPLGVTGPYLRGMWHGFTQSGPFWKERSQNLRATISAKDLSQSFTWSLGKLLMRASDIRPIPDDLYEPDNLYENAHDLN